MSITPVIGMLCEALLSRTAGEVLLIGCEEGTLLMLCKGHQQGRVGDL